MGEDHVLLRLGARDTNVLRKGSFHGEQHHYPNCRRRVVCRRVNRPDSAPPHAGEVAEVLKVGWRSSEKLWSSAAISTVPVDGDGAAQAVSVSVSCFGSGEVRVYPYSAKVQMPRPRQTERFTPRSPAIAEKGI